MEISGGKAIPSRVQSVWMWFKHRLTIQRGCGTISLEAA